jgi:hypothetical protein
MRVPQLLQVDGEADRYQSSGFEMREILNDPSVFFALCFVLLSLSTLIGIVLSRKFRPLEGMEIAQFNIVLTAALTLLGLIIGFTFSMAVDRYDRRKSNEDKEANAIGTEYVRAEFLPADDAAKVHSLLRKYLDQRILFYETRDKHRLDQINRDTARLQHQMWAVVVASAQSHETPTVALASSGMNDVLNSEGHTRAAWTNCIPTPAWILMGVIAICCNLLLGFSALQRRLLVLLVLPFILAVAFFFIAEVDSPRTGTIRVIPENLVNVAQSLNDLH